MAHAACSKIAFMVMNNKKILITFLFWLTQTVSAEDVAIDQIVAVVNDSSILMSEAQQRMATTQVSLRQAIDALVLERLQLQQVKALGIPDDDPQQAIAALRAQKFKGNVKVSEQEITDLIASQSETITQGERYHLQHILVALPPQAGAAQAEAARTKAQTLRDHLRAGEDFAKLARAKSDAFAAANGGDLGWQAAEKLPPSFTRALALLAIGEVSEVIRDDSGFHILKLLAREGGKHNANDLRVKAGNFLAERKAEEQYHAWLQNLRSKAFIEYRIPLDNNLQLH